MTPRYALDLSPDAITLLVRDGLRWLVMGQVTTGPGMDPAIAELAAAARVRENGGPVGVRLLLPAEHVLYLTLPAGSDEPDTRDREIRRALAGRTPYAVDELAFDWFEAPGGRCVVAATAKETLAEAEAFAIRQGFAPLTLGATPRRAEEGGGPDEVAFGAEPFFGPGAAAAELLPDGPPVARGGAPIRPAGPAAPAPAAAPVFASRRARPGAQGRAPGFAEAAASPPSRDAAPRPAPVAPDPVARHEDDPAARQEDDAARGVPDAAEAEDRPRRPARTPHEVEARLNRVTGGIQRPPAPPLVQRTPDEVAASMTRFSDPDADDGPIPPGLVRAGVAAAAVLLLAAIGLWLWSAIGDPSEVALAPEPGEAQAPPDRDVLAGEDALAGGTDTPGGAGTGPIVALPPAAPGDDAAGAAEADGADAQDRVAVAGMPADPGAAPPGDGPEDAGAREAPPVLPDAEAEAVRRAPRPLSAPSALVGTAPAVQAAPDPPLDRLALAASGEVPALGAGGRGGATGEKPRELARTAYEATGIWQIPPVHQAVPRAADAGIVEITQTAGPPVTAPSAPSLAAARAERAPPPDIPLPPRPAGPGVALARAAPSEDGTPGIDGVLLYAGVPEVRPPARPAAPPRVLGAFADPALAEARPRPRPGGLAPAAVEGSRGEAGAAAPVPTVAVPDPAPVTRGDSREGASNRAATGAVPDEIDADPDGLDAARIERLDVASLDVDAAMLGFVAAEAAAAPAPAPADMRPSPRPRARPGTGPAAPAAEASAVESAEAILPARTGPGPRPRPAGLVPLAGGVTGPSAGAADAAVAEATGPELEPEPEVPQFDASDFAVAASLRPGTRPDGMAARVASLLERRQLEAAARTAAASAPAAPAPAPSAAPSLPTRASVARAATVKNAIAMRRVALVGVFGSPSSRRALVRLPTGRYTKIEVGDSLDGGRVQAIGASSLLYLKGGRQLTLQMPQG